MSKYHVKNTVKDTYMTKSKKREMRHMMLPIFSRDNDSFQMDTFENNRKSTQPRYFLIAICINSRKAYAYPMKTKNTESVVEALTLLLAQRSSEGRGVSSMYSDEDTAYTSKVALEWMEKNQIDLHTTDEQHNHTNLALVNRLIRTLRDMNGNNQGEYNIDGDTMSALIEDYNSTPHSSTGIAPNDITDDEMNNHAQQKQQQSDIKRSLFHLFEGEKVRALQDWKPFEKKRYNLQKEYMKVNSNQGGGVLLEGKDRSVSQYPRWMLEAIGDDEAVPEKADVEVKGKKRYVMKKLLVFNSTKQKYLVEWEDGSQSWESVRNIRRGNPTKQSPLENVFWNSGEAQVV
jgi:hypothetical protein